MSHVLDVKGSDLYAARCARVQPMWTVKGLARQKLSCAATVIAKRNAMLNRRGMRRTRCRGSSASRIAWLGNQTRERISNVVPELGSDVLEPSMEVGVAISPSQSWTCSRMDVQSDGMRFCLGSGLAAGGRFRSCSKGS